MYWYNYRLLPRPKCWVSFLTESALMFPTQTNERLGWKTLWKGGSPVSLLAYVTEMSLITENSHEALDTILMQAVPSWTAKGMRILYPVSFYTSAVLYSRWAIGRATTRHTNGIGRGYKCHSATSKCSFSKPLSQKECLVVLWFCTFVEESYWSILH